MKILQPEGWTTPRGYANGIAARGTVVSIAGQIGWNAQGEFESDDFAAQARQALTNIVAVLPFAIPVQECGRYADRILAVILAEFN